MANLAVTNSFTNGTTADASAVNTNFSDIVTYINNRNGASAPWDAIDVTGNATIGGDLTLSASTVSITDTAANILQLHSNASTTELSINNTAADGDPILSFELGGTATHIFGVDDSDSDAFKFGTTTLTTNVAMQIPATGVQVQFPDGSAGTPSISHIGDPNTGLFFGTDELHASIAGTDRFSITSTAISLGLATAFPAGAAATPGLFVDGDVDTGIYGTTGILKVCAGGSDVAQFRNDTGTMSLGPSGAGNADLGGSLRYWNEVNYKTLTDRGCLGWFDDGVELQDGTVVSDCDSLQAIKKHPTKKTIYGVDMMDYRTFPKVAYKKAADGGKPLPRTEDDEPVEGQDGIEMTSMFSIMIGAIKELDKRLKSIEGK